MSYLWPIKDRRESRIIYICQLLGALLGIFVLTALNRWRIGYWQVLLGVFAGWFIGAFIYVRFAAKEKETDTEIAVSPNATAEKEKGFGGSDDANETENRFVIASDKDTDRYVELDDPCLNHFTYYNRFEIDFDESEFEYRVDGTKILVRLLQDFSVDPGKGKMWDVRDGVVMESDMRSRYQDEMANSPPPGEITDALRRLRGSIDEQIADMKKQIEWCELVLMGVDADIKSDYCATGSHLVGLKYFILSKHIPLADARRLIRQELERLKIGVSGFTRDAAKLGMEPAGKHGLRPIDGHSWPSGDEMKKVVESIPAFGISYGEFRSREYVFAVLEKLLMKISVSRT